MSASGGGAQGGLDIFGQIFNMGGSSSGSDDSNAASGSDSGSAGSYKVGIVQLPPLLSIVQ